MGDLSRIKRVELIRNNIINAALILFAIIGPVIMLLIIIGSDKERLTSFSDFYILALSVCAVILTSIFRKKLPLKFKVMILSMTLVVIVSINLFKFGFLGNARFFILAFPIFLSFILSYRQAIISLVFLTILFIGFGYLFSTGRLSYNFDVQGDIVNFQNWILSALVIFMTSWAIFYVAHFYSEAINANYSIIKTQNVELEKHKHHLKLLVDERTEELKTTNEELQATNEELFKKNRIISEKNELLDSTLKELKETQTKLFQSWKMASLGTLAAGVAHEVNNPLNFISGGYQYFHNYFKNLPEDQHPEDLEFFLGSMKTGVDRVTNIVSGLDHFSRDDNKHSEYCELHAIIDNSLSILLNKVDISVQVTKDYTESVCKLKCSTGGLHQVFTHILKNAIQSISTEGKISIRTEKIDDNLIVEITDTGMGIQEENLDRVTEPFFTTRGPEEGAGLGLSIAYNIIKEHQGLLEIESQYQKGTKITITLPVN